MTHQRTIAISLLITCLLLWATMALAAPAATVTHLSGPLVAQTVSGTTKSLSIGSKIEAGDTVETARRTYASLKFTDGSLVTLKPNTRFKVEVYAYDKAKPKDDAGSYSLIKGGLRTITGQIGKRGNQDSYQMKTPTATIGIRGTIYVAEYVSPEKTAEGNPMPPMLALADTAVISDAAPFMVADAGGGPPASDERNPGLYVQVLDGLIHVSNGGGSQNFAAGQFGYTPSFRQPPIILPSNPGMQFTPPPSFGSSVGGGGQGAGPSGGGADCQVR
ncbi:MAG: FecR domain-containing protein [Desulfuromonadaceae bacterium]|nr:FecR domain-containing protein [Desulfuromonadaceae bacterium]